MTICEELAKPIAKYASRPFIHKHDPDKPTLQYIFFRYWDKFIEYAKAHKISISDHIDTEVRKMISC